MITLTTTAARHTSSTCECSKAPLARSTGRQLAARSDWASEMPDLNINWERVRLDADKLLAALAWPSPARG
jgi:hypothetical protein